MISSVGTIPGLAGSLLPVGLINSSEEIYARHYHGFPTQASALFNIYIGSAGPFSSIYDNENVGIGKGADTRFR